ncbi:general transcriptional corepressor trfA-like isoform X1 [Bombus bifarius]|uniref:General transcriptional corepressor trfA-like isoform X1 n=2 Tax=Bombus bifarius TaxID=103933 RepID=A0A6P8MF53_9HYME|nr:general transcriptional corepressor trfA-like isoform X1 [Bombus bifarius]
MGKTPKKATPGGDERNLYNRRLKATTAPPNPSETSLRKRQHKSKISNRSKLNTLIKRVSHNQRKNFKSKIQEPMKVELERSPKQGTGNPDKTAGSSKEKKSIVSQQSEESNSAKMQPESEEADPKLNPTVQVEYTKDDSFKDTQESDKEYVSDTPSESISVLKTQDDLENAEVMVEKEQLECQKEASNSDKNQEDCQENNLNLQFEIENNIENTITEKTDNVDLKKENDEKCPPEQEMTKDDIHEKEDLQSESQTDTESNSADVIEFTTSEISEASEILSQNDVEKEKEKEMEIAEESISKNISFVSYDPSIMLKDVQIKLNDCLKENSKLFDTSNASHSMSSQPPKDMSFGKTLRSISGRRSLSRMRHVTLREYRYSPSDSMFVNTSSASLPQDEAMDFKILHYSTDLSDTLSTTNGSSSERKRKLDTEDWNSMKKQKTETENSLLHSPISLLKGLRKPIQVSTPVSDLKFKTGRLELDENSKPANEGSKKWCAIM